MPEASIPVRGMHCAQNLCDLHQAKKLSGGDAEGYEWLASQCCFRDSCGFRGWVLSSAHEHDRWEKHEALLDRARIELGWNRGKVVWYL